MIILGLPRSRTAWLSVFMSQSNTHFHHEAINGCNSMDEYRIKVNGCGDSTTALPFLKGELAGRKVVVIRKDKKELQRCIDWTNSEFGGDNEQAILDLDLELSLIDGLTINQSDIDNRLKEIWAHLVDDHWHDKYLEISKMNIQVQNTAIDSAAAKNLTKGVSLCLG